MKYIKCLPGVVLVFAMLFIQSCGGDEEGDKDNCRDEIIGTWEVTGFVPASANCTLTSYVFSTGPDDNILSMTIVDEARTLTGTGLIDSRCTEMTYTVSQGQTIISGEIQFFGSTFEDRSDFGCLVSASKR